MKHHFRTYERTSDCGQRYAIMRYLVLLQFAFVGCSSIAMAEPTSIRCEGKYYQQQQPYFVTYDLEKSRIVFESPRGNIMTGEIIAANDTRLDFSLRVTAGRTLFSFNRQRNVMTWPGMPAGELGRPLLQNDCVAVSGRTMLSAFSQQEEFDLKRLDPVDAFSLTCERDSGPFFITLDRTTKIVVVETTGASRIFPGGITSIDGDVIAFAFGLGPPYPHDAQWNGRSRSLSFGASNNQTRPATVLQCAVTKPRSIMVYYEEWARWGK